MSRERLLTRTLVELADTSAEGLDAVELLTLLTERCVEVLGASAAGTVLITSDGEVGTMASWGSATGTSELFEIQCTQGPSFECSRSSVAIVNQPVRASAHRWPRFAEVCRDAGYQSVCALPLRLRGQTIGVLSLFLAEEDPMGQDDLAAAQAFADVATIALLHRRCADAADEVIGELQHALQSRIVLEQAKGALAERAGTDVDGAFGLLRTYARNRNLRLIDVAQAVVERNLGPRELKSC
jgi:GAF domain-containing protein